MDLGRLQTRTVLSIGKFVFQPISFAVRLFPSWLVNGSVHNPEDLHIAALAPHSLSVM